MKDFSTISHALTLKKLNDKTPSAVIRKVSNDLSLKILEPDVEHTLMHKMYAC